MSLCHCLIHINEIIKPESESMHKSNEQVGFDSHVIEKSQKKDTFVKSVVLSHSASLANKQQISVEGVDVPWFHCTSKSFSL